MCPKRHSSTGMNTMHSSSTMDPGLRSTFVEENNDSGYLSACLPSLCLNDEMNSSLENTFSSMKIDNSSDPLKYDSGVYSDRQHNSVGLSGNDYINTFCGMDNADEDVALDNYKDCVTTNDDPRKAERMQLNIRAEEAELLFEGDKDGDNKLHLSIIYGHEACSKLLIKLAPEFTCLSFCNRLRQTPLHLAVLTRQANIARRLICAGASVLAQDKQGDTPLHIACRIGDIESVKHLLTPLQYEETQENNYNIPYIRIPQDFRVRNYEGQSCLHIAASFGHYNIVRMLLEAGADINAGDGKSGRSVLHLAADRDDVKLTDLLLSYSDLNIKQEDYAGLTACQLAYGRNHRTIIERICSLSSEYGIPLSDSDIL